MEHGHEVAGETKTKSTSTRSGVWRPLEGLMPVGDVLAPDPRGASEEVHVETREGSTCTPRCGTRLVELVKGCEVEVKIPCVPEWALMVGVVSSPGPGAPLGKSGVGNLYFIPLQVGCGFSLVLFRV